MRLYWIMFYSIIDPRWISQLMSEWVSDCECFYQSVSQLSKRTDRPIRDSYLIFFLYLRNMLLRWRLKFKEYQELR